MPADRDRVEQRRRGAPAAERRDRDRGDEHRGGEAV
jgi:hypothetical protein